MVFSPNHIRQFESNSRRRCSNLCCSNDDLRTSLHLQECSFHPKLRKARITLWLRELKGMRCESDERRDVMASAMDEVRRSGIALVCNLFDDAFKRSYQKLSIRSYHIISQTPTSSGYRAQVPSAHPAGRCRPGCCSTCCSDSRSSSTYMQRRLGVGRGWRI